MCKYVFKIITFSQGYTEAQIIQALGTRAGTSMQGLDKLHSYTAAQAQTQLDPLAQLEDTFALTGEETKQEAAATSQLVLASAPVSAPSRNSAACQQQVETAVKRMWDMVADNDEMQQHIVSELNRTEGALSKIQASHQNGSAHPMARLGRVQDTWGNSLVRRRS